jgi:hypothetical protein
MRGTERLGFGPRFTGATIFPNRVGSIECVLLGLGFLEKVKFHAPWRLIETGVARHPDVLESCFGSFGYAKAVQ